MTGLIATLLLEKDKQVQEVAQLLSDIETALVDKKLTEQEYVSLMVDVERLRAIIILADNVRVNVALNQAIQGIIELAKMIQ